MLVDISAICIPTQERWERANFASVASLQSAMAISLTG